MRDRAPLLAKNEARIRTADLGPLAGGWLDDGEIREHSSRTAENRRDVLRKLEWFLRQKGYDECGTAQLRVFLAYVVRGHQDPGGRWGNPSCTRAVKASYCQMLWIRASKRPALLHLLWGVPIPPTERSSRL